MNNLKTITNAKVLTINVENDSDITTALNSLADADKSVNYVIRRKPSTGAVNIIMPIGYIKNGGVVDAHQSEINSGVNTESYYLNHTEKMEIVQAENTFNPQNYASLVKNTSTNKMVNSSSHIMSLGLNTAPTINEIKQKLNSHSLAYINSSDVKYDLTKVTSSGTSTFTKVNRDAVNAIQRKYSGYAITKIHLPN